MTLASTPSMTPEASTAALWALQALPEPDPADRAPVDPDHEGALQTVDAGVEATPPVRADPPPQAERMPAARKDLKVAADDRRPADRRNAEKAGQLRRVTAGRGRLRGAGSEERHREQGQSECEDPCSHSPTSVRSHRPAHAVGAAALLRS